MENPFTYTIRPLHRGNKRLVQVVPIDGEPPEDFCEFGAPYVIIIEGPQGKFPQEFHAPFNADSIDHAFEIADKIAEKHMKQQVKAMTAPKILTAAPGIHHNGHHGLRISE